MKTIAIANQKGGVCKTTAAVNLAAGLQAEGKKILCLDFDPQCNTMEYLGHRADNLPTITDLLISKVRHQLTLPPTDGLIRHSTKGLDYIPGSLRLGRVETQLDGKEKTLRSILEEVVPEGYDYLIIDCGPMMNTLMSNALVAADLVLIPVAVKSFSDKGVMDMLGLIQTLKAKANPSLEILGFLPTMTRHTRLSREMTEWLHTEFPTQTFNAHIGQYEDADQAVRHHKMLIGGKSKVSMQYEAAAKELLERLEG